MKKYNVSFKTYHESYNGYDLCDGWTTYLVEARNSRSAINKAKKLWRKDFHSAYWISETSCYTVEDSSKKEN
jgi:hypothetical protein